MKLEREFLRRVLEGLDAGVLVLDPEGRLLLTNRAARQIHEISESAESGSLPDFTWCGEDGATPLPAELAPHRRALRGERVRSVELAIPSRDGSPRTVLASSRPILDGRGVVSGVVVIEHDITRREQGQERLHQSRKMEALGALAGGVSHDFNNLLNVILGYAEMCLEELPAEHRSTSKIQAILKAGAAAVSLTRQLRAFGGSPDGEPAILDLNSMVRQLETALRPTLGADIAIVTRLAADLGRVEADRGQVEQILTSLGFRAREAMLSGGTLTIQTANITLGESPGHIHVTDRPARHVMLSIGDTGAGMDAAMRSHVFEPIFTGKPRGDEERFGLAMAYNNVREAGGRIDVESEPESGTIFRIYFPEATEISGAALPSGSRDAETALVLSD